MLASFAAPALVAFILAFLLLSTSTAVRMTLADVQAAVGRLPLSALGDPVPVMAGAIVRLIQVLRARRQSPLPSLFWAEAKSDRAMT